MVALRFDVQPLFGALFHIPRIHRSRNQGVEVGVTPLTIIPNNTLAEFLFSVPPNLSSAVLESKSPVCEYINDSIELKGKCASWPILVLYAT